MSAAVREVASPARPLPWLGWLASLSLLGALVAGVAVWVHENQVPIVRLRISGTLAHVSAAQIQSVAAPYARAGFFDLDVSGLRDALEALPWVAQARVSRSWPGTIDIRIREHTAVARWGKDGVLTAEGSHFALPAASLPKALPEMHGPLGTEDDLIREYDAMRQPLAVDGYRIERLWIDDRGAWHVALDNGLALRLGRDHITQRVRRFLNVAVHALGPRMKQAEYIDLRYSNGFAVGWKNPSAADRGEK